jgi:hypothetical protein
MIIFSCTSPNISKFVNYQLNVEFIAFKRPLFPIEIFINMRNFKIEKA